MKCFRDYKQARHHDVLGGLQYDSIFRMFYGKMKKQLILLTTFYISIKMISKLS